MQEVPILRALIDGLRESTSARRRRPVLSSLARTEVRADGVFDSGLSPCWLSGFVAKPNLVDVLNLLFQAYVESVEQHSTYALALFRVHAQLWLSVGARETIPDERVLLRHDLPVRITDQRERKEHVENDGHNESKA